MTGPPVPVGRGGGRIKRGKENSNVLIGSQSTYRWKRKSERCGEKTEEGEHQKGRGANAYSKFSSIYG